MHKKRKKPKKLVFSRASRQLSAFLNIWHCVGSTFRAVGPEDGVNVGDAPAAPRVNDTAYLFNFLEASRHVRRSACVSGQVRAGTQIAKPTNVETREGKQKNGKKQKVLSARRVTSTSAPPDRRPRPARRTRDTKRKETFSTRHFGVWTFWSLDRGEKTNRRLTIYDISPNQRIPFRTSTPSVQSQCVAPACVLAGQSRCLHTHCRRRLSWMDRVAALQR